MKLSNLRIGPRLGMGFSLVVALLAAITALAITEMSEMHDDTTLLVNDRYPKIVHAQTMLDSNNEIARSVRNLLLTNDAAFTASERKVIADERRVAGEALGKLQKSIEAEKGKALLKEMSDARNAYGAQLDTLLALVAAGNRDEATAFLLGKFRDAQLAYMGRITSLIEFQQGLMAESGKKAQDTYVTARLIMLALAALAVTLAFAIAWVVARSVTRPIAQAVAAAEALARGDLTHAVEANSADEAGQLLRALQNTTRQLSGVVGGIKASTDTISTAASEIAAGNADLSQRTEEQASSLEETASSMEELASTVKANSENARQANELAASASEVAVKGGAVVNEVVQTMASINESSKKIADIIGVIDGIAFQTNILALNAAVEAARAGEQGRGFAVVASEVRTLAQRSASAAKEIKELISDSVTKVEAGTRLVGDAGSTMDEIVSSVRRVTGIMSEITAAASEQASGIDQVNQAVMQMDQVTQQNAALVEQAAAAAESMREQSQQLDAAVAVFKLEGAGAEAQTQAGAERVERRGPGRARNVSRLPAKAAAAKAKPVTEAKKTGTDNWKEF